MSGTAPPTADDELAATRFALRTADALGGTLNLRRTLRRIVDLAVPHLAPWAGLALVDGGRVRRVDSLGTDDFGSGRRPVRVSDLGRGADLLEPGRGLAVHPAPVPPDVITALGIPPGPAEALAEPEGVLVTAPLAGPSGRGVLTLVASTEPDLEEVRTFAERAARAVEAAFAYEERATLARTLRDSLQPAPLPAIAGIELGAAYRPAQETTQIGGDFYDVTPRPDGRWALSIGDVCGKGIEAAVLTGQVRQSVRTASLVTDEPARVLALLNETLLRADGTTFATAIYGVLDAHPGAPRLRLAAGGHPPPLLLRGGTVQALPTQGTLIGMLPEVSFEVVDVGLQPGDLLLLYTDGAIEARGPAGILGVEPVVAELADSAGLPAQAVTDRLMQLVMEHLQGWPHDDIALLALRCRPADDA